MTCHALLCNVKCSLQNRPISAIQIHAHKTEDDSRNKLWTLSRYALFDVSAAVCSRSEYIVSKV